jgi:hypothetical protein
MAIGYNLICLRGGDCGDGGITKNGGVTVWIRVASIVY